MPSYITSVRSTAQWPCGAYLRPEPTSSNHGDEVADASCYWGGCEADAICCSCSLADVCLGRVSLLFTHVTHGKPICCLVVCVPLCLPPHLKPRPIHACRQQEGGSAYRIHICCTPETALKASLLSLTMHLS